MPLLPHPDSFLCFPQDAPLGCVAVMVALLGLSCGSCRWETFVRCGLLERRAPTATGAPPLAQPSRKKLFGIAAQSMHYTVISAATTAAAAHATVVAQWRARMRRRRRGEAARTRRLQSLSGGVQTAVTSLDKSSKWRRDTGHGTRAARHKGAPPDPPALSAGQPTHIGTVQAGPGHAKPSCRAPQPAWLWRPAAAA